MCRRSSLGRSKSIIREWRAQLRCFPGFKGRYRVDMGRLTSLKNEMCCDRQDRDSPNPYQRMESHSTARL